MTIESNLVTRGVELGVVANEKYEEQLLAMAGTQIYEPDRLRNILLRMVPKR